MKLAAVIATAVYAQKGNRGGNDDTKELVEEHDYDADNWLDVEWAEDDDEKDEEEEDENEYLPASNWLDVEWPEESFVEDEEESDVGDFTPDNWRDMKWGELEKGAPEPQFVWHGESEVARYETCCGEPEMTAHTPDHPIYGQILPLKNHQLVQRRTSNHLFDDYIWTTWKSYQPGNPKYSVTVNFKEPIMFRELRLVPNPIPFGTWWYNKELSGICVIADGVKVVCTPDNFKLPAEPEEWNYPAGTHRANAEYTRDHDKWDKLRKEFYISFKSDGIEGIRATEIRLETREGAEAQYGDLKILFDKCDDSHLVGKYSSLHKTFSDDQL